jgi:excisionase family DNA binding protein
MDIENFLSITEAAYTVGVSRQTIYNWMKQGILGYVKKGSTRLVPRESVRIAAQCMKKNTHV